VSTTGEVLADRYELRRMLGRGGMGEVWHAFDRELERDVALKSLLPHLLTDPELVGRFRREARALARLRHPGIVAVFDILRLPDGRIYIVLEFVPGEPLDRTMARGPMSWERAAGIGAAVCDALEAAHREGVVHRDIKPGNILVEPRGQVRVADFGLARLQAVGGGDGDVITRTGIVMGTPGYWAPEQALGRRITPQTDLYALGAVLFEAATGRLPFVPEEPGPAAAFMHIAAPVPDPREVRPDLPAEAAALLMRALAKDPAERFASAADMAALLRESAAPRPAAPPAVPGEVPTVPPPAPTAPATALAGATEYAPGATAAAPGPTVAAPGATVAAAGATVASPGATVAAPAPTAASPAPTAPPPLATHGVPGPWSPPPGTLAPPPPSPPAGVPAPPSSPPAGTPAPAPPPAAAPSPAGRPAGRRAGAAALAGVAVLAAGAAVAGVLVGRQAGAETRPADPARTVSAAGISLGVPAEWVARTPAAPPGLTLAAGGAGATSPTGGGLVTGFVATDRPDLLPAALAADAPDPAPVTLSGTAGLRYEGVPTPGGERVTLYVLPTARGVATLACLPGAQPAAVAPACADAAASMRVSGTRLYAAGPSPAYAERLTAVFRDLGADVRAGRVALRGARLPAGQARAAGRLATAYRGAAAALPGTDLSPANAAANARVEDALRNVAAGYTRMRDAARADSPSRWQAGRAQVRAAEARLREARQGLAALGYRLG